MATRRFIYEFRSVLAREDESLRDWLHEAKAFTSYSSAAEAVSAAREALETDVNGRDEDEPCTIVKWGGDEEGKPYSDGGVWFELSDGDEGRVLVHTID